MADQRCSPRVLTAVLWADRQAGRDSLIFFRPLAVIDSSTRPPRPPPRAFAKPSRCNGRRFRTSVVRSIPSQSLNSAMLQLSLAFNASKIVPCVGRMPCRRISASKNRVMTRVTQRKLKQTQFSIADRSSFLGMVCICTTAAKLSNDFFKNIFQRLHSSLRCGVTSLIHAYFSMSSIVTLTDPRTLSASTPESILPMAMMPGSGIFSPSC